MALHGKDFVSAMIYLETGQSANRQQFFSKAPQDSLVSSYYVS